MENRPNHGSTHAEEELEEVWFEIEKDADGYPESKSWEGMLARPTSQGFELQSVPFYLKNVSRGDVVVAERGDLLRFSRVVERGGHNTYRILMTDALSEEIDKARADLEAQGLTVEQSEINILLAVDVPPSAAQQEIDAWLTANQAAGRWQIQDGYLSNIKTR